MIQKLKYYLLGILLLNLMAFLTGVYGSQATTQVLLASVIAALLEPWVSNQLDG